MSSLWILLVAVGAGAFGSMLGLGGGIILVPALTLIFNVPIKQAVGASLVGVVATSCAGVQGYLRAGLVDWQIAVRLLIPTVLGAIAGGLLVGIVPQKMVAGLFILLLLYVMGQMLWASRRPPLRESVEGECRARWTASRQKWLASGLSALGGIISALLGVGGGIIQVPLLHTLLNVPLRCAIGTSSFLIGTTASASALLYLVQGKLQPEIVVPATLGVLIGAKLGVHIAHRTPIGVLRGIFMVVMVYTIIRIYIKWFTGG
ncbi:MAG: sulfite exporter TauE/SafE family protein [Armatimonadota bacterium]